MPFTSVTKRNRRVEGHQGCVIPFWDDDFVGGVWAVVFGRWFRAVSERSEDMGDSSVLEVIGDIERGMVEFENGNDPENRDDCWDHDTG